MSPFLHRCQCVRGFFTLRPCDANAPHTCPSCRRTICDEHWAAQAAPPRCLECVARDDEAKQNADDYDAAWFHRYRHDYYTTHSYHAFYWGRTIDPYYNDYDLRSFNQAAADADDGRDDDGPGGLGDS